jgi:hypothetical protein
LRRQKRCGLRNIESLAADLSATGMSSDLAVLFTHHESALSA